MSALLDAVNEVLDDRISGRLQEDGYDDADLTPAAREAIKASRVGPDHPIMQAVYHALGGDEAYDHVEDVASEVARIEGQTLAG